MNASQGQHEVQVGTLLTWADRILSFVQQGDFLSAIELTRAYYVGPSPGNRNGLPESSDQLKEVVGEKMHELMAASARFTFSEERMTDGTLAGLYGQGVDQTALFEGLVSVCVRTCTVLDDYDFLYEDLFQYYDDHGIARIFLSQLEPFIIDGSLHHVPPRITQRLVAVHDDDGRPDLVERVIWHINPDCLDVNQAITLCQRHGLYDALFYVYNRAMRDYVSPIVELLALVRKIQQYRRAREEGSSLAAYPDDDAIEPVALNAYKVYPYLGNVLTGLAYPSAEPLPAEEANQAKRDVYDFLMSGHSRQWPKEEGGKLVLTADEDNGVEPTYPYARLLLRFDPEAFLHTLDLTFEDSYLSDPDDSSRKAIRLLIVKILLELASSGDLAQDAVTFVNIFIARNVPKYQQFLEMPLSTLHGILIGLADDPDRSTQEDRQLAAEYLLSEYTPHETDRIIALFEKAGFYHILRTWYRRERKWSPLLLTYAHDRKLPTVEVFGSLDDVLSLVKRYHKGHLPSDIVTTITKCLPLLLERGIVPTAALLDAHIPSLHELTMNRLHSHSDAERFAYLRFLLGPPQDNMEGDTLPVRKGGASMHVPPVLRRTYLSLHCRLDPSNVITSLRYLPPELLDAPDVARICEEHGIYDAVIWALDSEGTPLVALGKAEEFEHQLSARLAESLVRYDSASEASVQDTLAALGAVGQRTVAMCIEHSKSSDDVPLEDIWYHLLKSQIDTVQRVAVCCLPDPSTAEPDKYHLQQATLSSLRRSMQSAFTALMTISSAKGISLPRLFKRLLTTASQHAVSKPSLYAEFRTLFTGMLETYHSDGDMLIITKHLVDRDLFSTVEELTQERLRGWAPSQGRCQKCRQSLVDGQVTAHAEDDARTSVPIAVSRTGALYHQSCLTPNHQDNIAVH